jgi:LysR family transcriptional regulator (chromosome initiation inhibitor)
MNAFDPAALDCLAALADAGSFDGAAQRLSITQSAVSQRLRALEAHTGRLLVVRSRPLRFTEPGKVLLRFARQMRAMRSDLSRELGATLAQDERLPVAVNADSLATWVLPALNDLVHAGLQEGFGIELLVDDQDFTHDWLREGAVLGCVTTVSEPLRGCRVTALGAMRYIAVASPNYLRDKLPDGLHQGNFMQPPWLVFNRKDDMHALLLRQALGVQGARLKERPVPSTEAQARAAVMGWGIAVLPEAMAQAGLQQGQLQALLPDSHVDVQLHWHQWQAPSHAQPDERVPHDGTQPWPQAGEQPLRGSALDRVGRALVAGASLALRAGTAAALPAPPAG